jgi:hypothetical protein
MTRWAAVILTCTGALVSVAVAAAAFTPLPGHYKGHDGGDQPVSFDFDGEHIRNVLIDREAANSWSIPRYDAGGRSLSGGNSDGGFFVGHWVNPAYVTGSYRPLSRAHTVKYDVHRVPQPEPGKYQGQSHQDVPVSFTLIGHRVLYFNYSTINKVSATVHGPDFVFSGVHNSRNTRIEGYWTNDHHLKGWITQTGRARVDWEATLAG